MKIGNLIISFGPQQRFGLPQAEGAMKFAKDPAQVGAVLGVVVGVLGYENAVAADVASANADAQAQITASKADISTNEKEIAALKRHIIFLEGQVKMSTDRQAELAEIAKLFGGK